MNVTKKITIDLNRPRKEVVHLGQGDSFTRWIELTLLCDGVPYDPTADLAALGIQDGSDADIVKTVKYIKANGVPGEYEKIPENGTTPAVALMDGETNVYIVRLDEHATDVPGFAEVFVTFYVEDSDGDIHVLHSFPITIDVVQNTTNATDSGSPYYNIHSFYVKPVGGIPLNDLSESAKGIFSDEAKYSLIALLSKVAYIDTHGQQYIDDLTQKLFPTAYLVSITADYEQDRPIYDTDDLDAIKAGDDLTVTANYSDGSSVVLDDDDYTLSGTLVLGETCNITVGYGGKTATIEVVVSPVIFEITADDISRKTALINGYPYYSTATNQGGLTRCCYKEFDIAMTGNKRIKVTATSTKDTAQVALVFMTESGMVKVANQQTLTSGTDYLDTTWQNLTFEYDLPELVNGSPIACARINIRQGSTNPNISDDFVISKIVVEKVTASS